MDLCLFDWDMKGRIIILAISQAPAWPGAPIKSYHVPVWHRERLAAHKTEASIITISYA